MFTSTPTRARVLLEKAVNTDAAASAFGAARVYVPTETFTEMFAWEQVAEYLRRAAAPREVGDRVERLHAGSEQDRADSATEKFGGLIAFFRELLDYENRPGQAQDGFAQRILDARRIVTVWYELTGRARTPEEQAVLLSYANPFYSLTEPAHPKDVKEWETKTYKENAAARGVRRARRSRALASPTGWRRSGGATSTPTAANAHSRRDAAMCSTSSLGAFSERVDDLFIRELERRRLEFAQSGNAPEQGTPLTRLFAEVTWMLGDRGPLRKVSEVLGQFVAAVGGEQAERDNRYVRALQELRESRRAGLIRFGTWVEDYQQAARDECSEFVRWYQKHELLRDMQHLVFNVERRLREWERLLTQLFDALVRREGRDERSLGALHRDPAPS